MQNDNKMRLSLLIKLIINGIHVRVSFYVYNTRYVIFCKRFFSDLANTYANSYSNKNIVQL